MPAFSPQELETIDEIWRALPADHVWSGWSAQGDSPSEIVLYRTRAHWRKFPLRKSDQGFSVFDDRGRRVAIAASLEDLITRIEAIPGLMDPEGSSEPVSRS